MWWLIFAAYTALLLMVGTHGLGGIKICVLETVTDTSCNTLQRGDSPISCERVFDSADCAIKMSQGKAHFGIFTAEELLITHQFYRTGIQVVAELRQKDYPTDPYEFETVAVVPATYEPSPNGFGALFGKGYCHPGFSKSQTWNDHILKFFETKAYNNVCRSEMTVAENEAVNLRDFFKKACRPGEWVSDKEVDRQLKTKYPELCALCDDDKECKYKGEDYNGPTEALNCLVNGKNEGKEKGGVAYSSLRFVREYFAPNQNHEMSNYKFLCQNGTVQPLNSNDPCTWFKQPWNSIVSTEEKSVDVIKILKESLLTHSGHHHGSSWQGTLNSIILQSDLVVNIFDNYKSPASYLGGEEMAQLPKPICGDKIRWCTTSEMERNKCKWVAADAAVLGINPAITCHLTDSTFECFRAIANKTADIITIDSNYGYLARKLFNLSPIMYSETVKEKNSFVVAVVRERPTPVISSFSDLQGRNACFPEYGGIAYLSFLNVTRSKKLVTDTCKYAKVVSTFLNYACAPGAQDKNHNVSVGSQAAKKLCKLCGEKTCDASPDNKYFGDAGAIACLDDVGDIAFLEARNLKSLITANKINQSHYRVLCKNGTLAQYTGFDVDDHCALSITIDSEVITRRDESERRTTDLTLALLKLEDSLGYTRPRIPIHIYDPFNGTHNLFFKDSTTALVKTSVDVTAVKAYKELFSHVDACSNTAASIVFNNFIVLQALLIIFIVSRFS